MFLGYTGVSLSVRLSVPTDFSETLQEWSLGHAHPEYFKDLNSMKNSGCDGNQKNKL